MSSTAHWSRDFTLVEGEAPVAEALASIRNATTGWIIIRRFGSLLYVYRRAELFNHARLRRLWDAPASEQRMPLAEALDLHEEQSSDQTENQVQSASELRPPGAPPSVGRTALVSAPGQPLAVAIPTAELPRSAPRRMRSMKHAKPPAQAPTAEAAPPPAAAGARPPATDDEGTSPIRYPSIEPDAPPRAGQSITLTVDLLRERSTTTTGDAIQPADLPEDWSELQVSVQLVCPQIDFASGATGTVVMRRNAASVAATVRGTVRADVAAGSRIHVTAVFMYQGRFGGTAIRELMAVGGETTTGAPATTPAKTEGAVLIEPTAVPPDLTVHVMVPSPSSPGKLLWLMTPRELFDGLPLSLEGDIDVGTSAQTYATSLFKEFAQLERQKHMRRLEGFGDRLWKCAPQAFRDTYWALWDRYQRPFTIQFISSEPNIPWELMRPTRPGESHKLLAVQHPVARWIANYRSLLRQRLPSGFLFSVVPRYRNAAARLALAEKEAERLEQALPRQIRSVPATYDGVTHFLESDPAEPVAILHFAGHGTFSADAADNSTIKLEDGSLAVDEVAREDVKLGVACRTLVFLNACEVGATGSALGAVGGWADAFLGRRFGGFIAPLWAVDDEDAGAVSTELLTGILRDSRPIGSVLREIRETHGATSPTFLSYLFYGDVNATIGAP